MEFQQYKDSIGQVVAKQETELQEENDRIQILLQEAAQMREEIAFQSKLTATLRIENQRLKKTQTVILQTGERCDTYALQSDCAKLEVEVTADEVNLKDLSIQTDIILSLSKKGNVSAVFSNPCIHVNSMNSLQVQPKQKWWQNGWLRFGLGVAAGASFIFVKK